MRIINLRFVNRCAFGLIAASAAAAAGARDSLPDQPPIWSTKPDVTAFEKIENDRLNAAQRSIDKIVAVKGAKTMTRKVSAAQTALSLNRDVYQALAAVPLSQADPATQYYLRRQLLEFR